MAAKEIDALLLNKLGDTFNASSKNLLAQKILTKNDFGALSSIKSAFASNHLFSNMVTPEFKVTNQKSSGRCWLFAALNILRHKIATVYDLPDDFELSQSWLFFWDKFEKANWFAEIVLEVLKEESECRKDKKGDDGVKYFNDLSRTMQFLMMAPVQDGGQWDMFVNIIEKV